MKFTVPTYLREAGPPDPAAQPARAKGGGASERKAQCSDEPGERHGCTAQARDQPKHEPERSQGLRVQPARAVQFDSQAHASRIAYIGNLCNKG